MSDAQPPVASLAEATEDLTCFRVEVPAPHVARVVFDRPPVNAQNRRSRQELIRLMDLLSERDDITVVILTGAGEIFSAGADIKERIGMQDASDYRHHNRITRDFFYAVTDCAKPVIGAINGAAIGAGFALAAGCDILLASEQAYVQMPEIDRGLMGGAKFLERHLPRSVARLLFLTGRRLGARDLWRHGAVVDVVAPDELQEAALTIAREVAGKHPEAVRTAKATFNVAEELSYRDGYRFEQSVTERLASSDYARESQAAFLEKRPADHQ